MSAGGRLQEERKRLGLNQTDFGSIGGVSRRTQMSYETNGSSPDIKYWESISRIGADIQYILTGLPSVNAGKLCEHPANNPGTYKKKEIDAGSRQKHDKKVWDELFGLLNPEDRARLMEIAVTLAEAHVVKNHPGNIR